MENQRATVERVGYVTMECPECRQPISTHRAHYYSQIPGGLRFCGVPCDGCGKSFTIEMVERRPMSDKIEPALSAERWERLRAKKNHGQFAIITLEGGNDQEIGAFDAAVADTIEAEDAGRERDEAKRIAAAIAALNDGLRASDPRKITRHTIWIIRTLLRDAYIDPHHPGALRFRADAAQLADALESYLPPEPT